MSIDFYQPPLTMDDIWIPSEHITKLLEALTRHFTTVDEPPLVFRSHLRMIRSKREPKPTFSPNHSYKLFCCPDPEPYLELLGVQFVADHEILHGR
jgi:hypothetical protein